MNRDRNPVVICGIERESPLDGDPCPRAEYVDPGEDVFAFRARIEAKGWRVSPGVQWCPQHSGRGAS